MTPKQKILIVDDRKENLLVLRGVLADVDAEVVAASNGHDALAATLHHDFALALLDVQMPEMDGYELAELLRGAPGTRRLPIVFLTAAYGEKEQVFKGYEAGAVDYLIKPYDPQVLLSKVRVFLDLHRATSALAEKVAALAASEERYRSLVMTVPDIVYRIDPEGRFSFLNDAVRNLGYTPDELIGTHFSAIMLPPDVEVASRESVLPSYVGTTTEPDDTPRLFDERRSGVRRSAGLEVRLVPNQCKTLVPGLVLPVGNELIAVEVNSSGLYSAPYGREHARFLGTVGIIRDITERKRFEHMLHEKNRELESAKLAAEQANLAKSEFLSSMSHELRTPLNAVLGFAQLLDSSTTQPPSPGQKPKIDQILKAGWHLLGLINEILDLAKIESGKVPISREPMSLSEVLQDSLAMIAPLAQQREIQVVFHGLDVPYHVYGDPSAVKQVLINLLSNAIKYNRTAGTLTVQCVMSGRDWVRVSVRDSGSGLAPEQLAQLFQPFNRLGQETGSEEGTGIGLVVTKQLVELMGGVIGVESCVGVGSVFWFELATASAPKKLTDDMGEAGQDQRNQAAAHEWLSQRTLLYVEDNPSNLSLVEKLIARRSDLKLLTAINGHLGIQLARAYQPDIILMDINLPDISGYDALNILRDDPATAHIPVVALSARAIPSDIEKGMEAGFFRYLTKPIKVIEFMDALDITLHYAAEKRHGSFSVNNHLAD